MLVLRLDLGESMVPSPPRGGPLALIIYTERPYFRLVVMRPTDHQVRLYLHHAFGYFDVDQKINRGTLHTGDILWPDWAELKAKAVTETSKERRFYFNEAFLGFPPNGTMSRFATDTLMKYHDDIRSVIVGVGETDGYKESFAIKFGPFRGAMKSFLIAMPISPASVTALSVDSLVGALELELGPTAIVLSKATVAR
ncbi:hypothetical protein EGR_06468 [Echinococcus granulosus]|uniref:Uncharacterized protein n=1 Tax=Echinococcus granulosus TaxID=6210 RepID=W6UKR7_ECHGR|nr:hypothetical protein EGR_06468 [Echinococcus granulosus]EUB58682.1 hypothetical protein EGR_06468 [Echinococcus granulosus]